MAQNLRNLISQNTFRILGVDKMTPEEQEKIINRVGGIIFQSVLLRALPTLDEKSLKEYEKLMDAKAEPETVLDFFFEKVPDFLRIITEESEKFQKESAEALGKT